MISDRMARRRWRRERSERDVAVAASVPAGIPRPGRMRGLDRQQQLGLERYLAAPIGIGIVHGRSLLGVRVKLTRRGTQATAAAPGGQSPGVVGRRAEVGWRGPLRWGRNPERRRQHRQPQGGQRAQRYQHRLVVEPPGGSRSTRPVAPAGPSARVAQPAHGAGQFDAVAAHLFGLHQSRSVTGSRVVRQSGSRPKRYGSEDRTAGSGAGRPRVRPSTGSVGDAV